MSLFCFSEFKSVANESELLLEGSKAQADLYGDDNILFGGIVFSEDFIYGSGNSIPKLDYTLRFQPDLTNRFTQLLFPFVQITGPGSSGSQYNEFIRIQNILNLAYTEMTTGTNLLPESITDIQDLEYITAEQRMPYPEYLDNNLAIFLGFMLPLFTVLSFAFSIPPILKRIVHEKETGVKELTKLMGLPTWLHWLGWFLNALFTSIITIVIIVVLVCVEWKSGSGKVMDYSHPFFIFLFFVFYASALIASLFFFSTFFDSRKFRFLIINRCHTLHFLKKWIPKYRDDSL